MSNHNTGSEWEKDEDLMSEEELVANIQAVRNSIRKNMQSFAINTDNFDEEGDNYGVGEFVDLPDPNDFYSD